MRRLKTRVYLDTNHTYFIDFAFHKFKGIFHGKPDVMNLNPKEKTILVFLCMNHDKYVAGEDILSYLQDTLKDVEEVKDKSTSKIMYSLRKKMICDLDSDSVIQSNNHNMFMLALKEDPFEDDDNEVEQLRLMNEELKSENEKQKDEIKELQAALADLNNKTYGQLDTDTEKTATNLISLSTTEFFKQAFSTTEKLGRVSGIDLVLSNRDDWISRHLDDIAIQAYCRNIPLRVIVNIPSIHDVAVLAQKSEEDEYSFYIRAAFSRWSYTVNKLCQVKEIYNNEVEIHRVEIPILHDIYIVKGDKGNGWVRTRYNTYGNCYNPFDNCFIDKEPVLIFRSPDEAYYLYQKEFEYMWKLSLKNGCWDNGIYDYLTLEKKDELEKLRKRFDQVFF